MSNSDYKCTWCQTFEAQGAPGEQVFCDECGSLCKEFPVVTASPADPPVSTAIEEIDEETFYYWLEVLPPVFIGARVKLLNGETVFASFGFAEGGNTPIKAFWRKAGKYFSAFSNLKTDSAGNFRGFQKLEATS